VVPVNTVPGCTVAAMVGRRRPVHPHDPDERTSSTQAWEWVSIAERHAGQDDELLEPGSDLRMAIRLRDDLRQRW